MSATIAMTIATTVRLPFVILLKLHSDNGKDRNHMLTANSAGFVPQRPRVPEELFQQSTVPTTLGDDCDCLSCA